MRRRRVRIFTRKTFNRLAAIVSTRLLRMENGRLSRQTRGRGQDALATAGRMPALRDANETRMEPNLMRFRFWLFISFVAVLCMAGSSRAQTKSRVFELEGISPQFWEVVDHDAKLETVAAGFGFTEGPMWDPAGFLYVSDETINKIFRVYPDGKKEDVIALGDPDGNTFDRQHRLIDCASVLRAIIAVTSDGKYTVLADRYDGKKFNSPNDVIVGPDGALYFTDPTLDLVAGEKQEIPFQGVYRLDEKGNVRLLTKDLSQPNGLAFSPDGKHFYVDDSEKRNIRVYDVAGDGSLENGHIFGEEPGVKGDGVPDGIKVDKHGNLYVTGPRESGCGIREDIIWGRLRCRSSRRILRGEMRITEPCTSRRPSRCTGCG